MPTIVSKVEGPHYKNILEVVCPLCANNRMQVQGLDSNGDLTDKAREIAIRHNKTEHEGDPGNVILIRHPVFDKMQVSS